MTRRRTPPPPRFLTRQEVADLLACSVDTVDRRIRDGRLRAVVDGRLVRIAQSDLDTYMRSHKTWR